LGPIQAPPMEGSGGEVAAELARRGLVQRDSSNGEPEWTPAEERRLGGLVRAHWAAIASAAAVTMGGPVIQAPLTVSLYFIRVSPHKIQYGASA
jgi:hypothetical protein